MKKTLALILTGVLLVLSLASCGSSKDYVNYANTDLTAYVTPGAYKDLTVELPHVDPVDDAAVDAEIDNVLDAHKDLVTVERAAANGDTVNIDYVGSIDGVEFQGGNTEGNGADLVIGSHSYIDDFEEQLIGHHPGDSVDVTVTFPEDYGKDELNGKEALFKVTVNGIYK